MTNEEKSNRLKDIAKNLKDSLCFGSDLPDNDCVFKEILTSINEAADVGKESIQKTISEIIDAEFENKFKWHFISKGDLPKENGVEYLTICKTLFGKSARKLATWSSRLNNFVSSEYSSDIHPPYAWCELSEIPEENEND